tara:strand:+ start:10338 stop:11885 length:1548 start_codon:yes stop_codon:yes gene_type:complete
MAELTMDADVLIKFLAEISDFQDKVTQVTGELDTVTEKQAEVAQSGSDMAKATGSSMQAMAGVASIARQVNPQLGRMATVTMGVTRAMRGFGIAAGTAMRVMGPLAVAVGVGYGAFRIWTAESRKAKEAAEQFAAAQDSVQDAVTATADILLRAKVITGEMTQLEADRIENAATLDEIFKANQTNLRLRKEALESEISALHERNAAIREHNAGVLEDIQNRGAAARELEQIQPFRPLVDEDAFHELQVQLRDVNYEIESLERHRGQTERALEIIAQKANEAATGDAGGGDVGGGVSGLVDAFENLNTAMQDLPTETFRFDGAEMDLREPLQQNEESAKEMAITYSDAFGSMANSAGKLNQALGGDAQEQFKRGQALALAEVAFNTASAVMKALPNIPLSVAMGTAGAANAALVMAQQPPPAHMGLVPSSTGPLAPDEMNTRVLKGEAVLDRATVRRMGGAQGVRDLMQGGGGNGQTVVVVPWKHLDRELQSSGRANSRFGRTMRRNAQISTGQRG